MSVDVERETPFYGRFQDEIDAIIEAVRTQDGVGGIRAFQAFADAVVKADRAQAEAERERLREAAQRLSDAIANQAAIGSDGLFPAAAEFDARQEYLTALKELRAALAEATR